MRGNNKYIKYLNNEFLEPLFTEDEYFEKNFTEFVFKCRTCEHLFSGELSISKYICKSCELNKIGKRLNLDAHIKYSIKILLEKTISKSGRISPNYTNIKKLDRYYPNCKKFMENLIKTDYVWCRSFCELLFCLKNNIISSPKCDYCENIPIFKDGRYKKICKNLKCKTQQEKDIRENNSKSQKGKKQSKEFVEKRINKLRGRKRSPSFCQKIKDLWQTDEYRNKIIGKQTDESRKKQSESLKKTILEGRYTPTITNSWTHFQTKIDNKKFRSSFEGIFYIYKFLFKGENIEYEKLRIPYLFNDVQKIYIVDFIDFKNKIVFEIKPKSQIPDIKNQAKNLALIKWCLENNFLFEYIDEDKIFSMFKEMKCNNFFHNFFDIFRGKYAKFL